MAGIAVSNNVSKTYIRGITSNTIVYKSNVIP